MMSQAEFIGMMIVALSAIAGLLIMAVKPLTKNTETLTMLKMSVDQLISRLDTEQEKHEEYKEKMKVSQKRQWDAIDEIKLSIMENKAELNLLKEHLDIKVTRRRGGGEEYED